MSLSDPARSTRLRVPQQVSDVTSLVPEILNKSCYYYELLTPPDLFSLELLTHFNMKTEWDLEDLSLHCVASTALCLWALFNRFITCAWLATSSTCRQQ